MTPYEQVYDDDIVIVVKRSHDYMAHIKGDTRLWDCGFTISGVIGRLYLTHPTAFRRQCASVTVPPSPTTLSTSIDDLKGVYEWLRQRSTVPPTTSDGVSTTADGESEGR